MLRKKIVCKNIVLDPTQTFFAPFFLIFLKLYILLLHHCGVSTTAFKQLGERLQLKWLLFPPRKIHHQAKLAWSFKVWPSKFSKNWRGKFYESFKINSTIANWEFGIIVRTEYVWLEVITSTLPPATELTQALLT